MTTRKQTAKVDLSFVQYLTNNAGERTALFRITNLTRLRLLYSVGLVQCSSVGRFQLYGSGFVEFNRLGPGEVAVFQTLVPKEQTMWRVPVAIGKDTGLFEEVFDWLGRNTNGIPLDELYTPVLKRERVTH